MDTQAFEYVWQWGWLAGYMVVLGVGVAAYHLMRHRQHHRKARDLPVVSWRYSMGLSLALGAALGALANSNAEFEQATAHREANKQALEVAGYRYRDTLDQAPRDISRLAGCEDGLVVDWDFRLSEGAEAIRHHVFCREGKSVVELASHPRATPAAR